MSAVLDQPPLAAPTVDAFRPSLWLDPWWRITNLYKIVDERNQVQTFAPNEEQYQLYHSLHTRNLILKARQLGFTTLICLLALDQCLFNSNFSAGIIAHNREDAEKFFRNKVMFAYDRLPKALRDAIPITKRTESQVTFANGSSLYVGTSFRGGTLQLLHISEFGKICRKYPEKAKEIVTGAIESVAADNLVFIESTAEGMGGYFFDYCMAALKATQEGSALSKLDWKLHFFPWFAKGAYQLSPVGVNITDKQVKYFREMEAKTGITLTPEQKAWWVKKKQALLGDMGREYPGTPQEAFEQAVEGAIYGEQMTRIRELGRITSVPFQAGIPVNTFWDFGVGDANPIWLHQRVGLQNHWIKYFIDSNRGLAHYWKLLNDWAAENGAIWGKHYLPHDAEASLQGEQVTNRRQILEKLGMRNIEIVPRVRDIETGIDITRTALVSDNWFDKDNCAEGILALDSYQYEWDQKLGRWKDNPLHNWASHGSDAYRQFAQGYKPTRSRSEDDDGRRRRERNPKVL
jgi:hypothetical protein